MCQDTSELKKILLSLDVPSHKWTREKIFKVQSQVSK